jgi:cytosolic prostaglandin-E synthase
MTTNTAPVKWAQRKDSLYVTISLADVKDHKIELTDRKLTFSGKSGEQAYHLDLELVRSLKVFLILTSFF